MPAGRPSNYRPEFADIAYKLCLLGCSIEHIADTLETKHQVLRRWQRVHPEFREAFLRAGAQADGNVAGALYKRACGYDVEQSKVGKDGELVTWTQHIPPDVNAASFWLRNRQSDLWRDRTEVVHDISDRVADRLEAARQRMLGQLNPPVIEHEPQPMTDQMTVLSDGSKK